jgi:hypothetical protein
LFYLIRFYLVLTYLTTSYYIRSLESRFLDLTTEEGKIKYRQARSDTLDRIDVRTSYDPWELLDVLTVANGTSKKVPFGDEIKDPFLSRPDPPPYDLIIIDSLHNLLTPYYGISGSELRSDSRTVSGTGNSPGILGKNFELLL